GLDLGMVRPKFEVEPRKLGLLSPGDTYSRQMSPVSLKLSVLVSPEARPATSSDRN
ncbi:hypothetical protein A2U01_0105853, partial [Trifolium medium]|nr:hypothetical protein [Trifolium medium]